MEEALKKIAEAISNKCVGGCPCRNGCEVYSDEECINRIIDWIKSVIGK